MDTSTLGSVIGTIKNLVYNIPAGVQVPLLGVSFWTFGILLLILDLIIWAIMVFFGTSGSANVPDKTQNNNNHTVYRGN